MNITFKIKDFFFDLDVVLKEFGRDGKQTLSALSRAGAFVRRRARNLLRIKGKAKRMLVSPPGQPPTTHTSDTVATLRNILFAYDPQSGGVVVGSVWLNMPHRDSTPVPNLLEAGGTVSRHGRTLHYRPHPWMQPALQQEVAAGTIPACWNPEVRM